jgi:hypothetical protein
MSCRTTRSADRRPDRCPHHVVLNDGELLGHLTECGRHVAEFADRRWVAARATAPRPPGSRCAASGAGIHLFEGMCRVRGGGIIGRMIKRTLSVLAMAATATILCAGVASAADFRVEEFVHQTGKSNSVVFGSEDRTSIGGDNSGHVNFTHEDGITVTPGDHGQSGAQVGDEIAVGDDAGEAPDVDVHGEVTLPHEGTLDLVGVDF